MKKICVVTWYKSINYGTCLQAFAAEPITIFEEIVNRIHRWREEDTSINKDLIKEEYKSKMPERDRAVDKFVDENLVFTNINSVGDYKHVEDNIDCFVSGSDQLWNPNHFRRYTMLSFVKNKKKVAYAASFGVPEIPKARVKTYKKLMSKYSAISVREANGKKIVKDLIGREAVHVLDPTMLLSPKDWTEIASGAVDLKKQNEAYLLCYFVGEHKEYWENAQKMANKLGLKIKIVPYNIESYNNSNEKVWGVGPKEFLDLIKNASFICTDSFHASVFCINFRRDFFVYKRFSDKSTTSQNSRLTSLLNMLKLDERLLDLNGNYIEGSEHITNYDEVHKILDSEREKSRAYLLNAIEK